MYSKIRQQHTNVQNLFAIKKLRKKMSIETEMLLLTQFEIHFGILHKSTHTVKAIGFTFSLQCLFNWLK